MEFADKISCLNYDKSMVSVKGNKFGVIFKLDSRTIIHDNSGNIIEEFYHCCLCRTEKVFGNYPLFASSHLGFTPVFGTAKSIIFRSAYTKDKDYRSIHDSEHMLGGFKTHIITSERFQKTSTAAAIEAATDFKPIIARTCFKIAKGINVMVEYPVKTFNINKAAEFAQVDTGPVCVPLANNGLDIYERMSLAHVAFYEEHKADFIVEDIVAACKCDFKEFNLHGFAQSIIVDCKNSYYKEE